MIVRLITIIAVALGAFGAPMAFAAEGNSGSILVHFNISAGQWALPHDDFFRPGVDLETDLDKDGKLLTVRIDLNDDGVPEYFLRTLCGNGGCEYPIFDGRTHAFLGSVFGSEVWLLRRRSHALPVIETFGHVAAMRGTMARYEFNGSRYEMLSSREIGDEETQLLYKRLDAASRIETQ
jgi:hypothetical protein